MQTGCARLLVKSIGRFIKQGAIANGFG